MRVHRVRSPLAGLVALAMLGVAGGNVVALGRPIEARCTNAFCPHHRGRAAGAAVHHHAATPQRHAATCMHPACSHQAPATPAVTRETPATPVAAVMRLQTPRKATWLAGPPAQQVADTVRRAPEPPPPRHFT